MLPGVVFLCIRRDMYSPTFRRMDAIRIKRGIQNLPDFIELQKGFCPAKVSSLGTKSPLSAAFLLTSSKDFPNVDLLQVQIVPGRPSIDRSGGGIRWG